jgi:hypothetical protein
LRIVLKRKLSQDVVTARSEKVPTANPVLDPVIVVAVPVENDAVRGPGRRTHAGAFPGWAQCKRRCASAQRGEQLFVLYPLGVTMHEGHAHGAARDEHARSLNRTAASATLHCLTGCAIGEVLGMVIGTALGLGNPATIALAVFLAFVFGYSLTMLPLLQAGLALGVALPLAFASDSFSIAVMELVDNGIVLGVPGAMDATLSSALFWGSLAFSLAVAYVFAFPLNRYLIARGQGHAVVHAYHGHGGDDDHDAAPAIGSRRRLVLLGLGAMGLTIAVATIGALIVESRDSDEHEDASATHVSVGRV